MCVCVLACVYRNIEMTMGHKCTISKLPPTQISMIKLKAIVHIKYYVSETVREANYIVLNDSDEH